jgi:hypothetical protein
LKFSLYFNWHAKAIHFTVTSAFLQLLLDFTISWDRLINVVKNNTVNYKCHCKTLQVDIDSKCQFLNPSNKSVFHHDITKLHRYIIYQSNKGQRKFHCDWIGLSGVTLVQICIEIEVLEKIVRFSYFETFLHNFEFLPWLQIFNVRNARYSKVQFILFLSILEPH